MSSHRLRRRLPGTSGAGSSPMSDLTMCARARGGQTYLLTHDEGSPYA
jgi:hypothetical protein